MPQSWRDGVLGVSLDQNDKIYQFIVETLVAAHGMVTSPTSCPHKSSWPSRTLGNSKTQEFANEQQFPVLAILQAIFLPSPRAQPRPHRAAMWHGSIVSLKAWLRRVMPCTKISSGVIQELTHPTPHQVFFSGIRTTRVQCQTRGVTTCYGVAQWWSGNCGCVGTPQKTGGRSKNLQ